MINTKNSFNMCDGIGRIVCECLKETIKQCHKRTPKSKINDLEGH